MKFKLISNRMLSSDNKFAGYNNENRAELLEFVFPENLKDYTKTINFRTPEGNFFDILDGDTYTLKNNITKYDKVYFYIEFKKQVSETEYEVIKTEVKTLNFNSSFNVDKEISEEEINILDKLIVKIDEIDKRVTYLEEHGGAVNSVNSVNGKTGDVNLNAEDVGALPNTTKIPVKTSDLNNDSGFIDKTYHDNAKVDKEYGKVLSTNDYTDEEKEKLSQLENYDDTQIKSDVNEIEEKIPTQATNNNQLADKDFVNSSLNSITAFYITKNTNGDQFNSKAELDSSTTFYSGGEERAPTRNDYCIVLEDETKDNSTTRYIYQNNQWEFQYVVNETALTSEQVSALNSGITLELVAKLQGINLTDVQINGKSIVTNGIATIPIASRNKPLTSGLVAIQPSYGISTNSSNVLMMGAPSSESEISKRKSNNSSRLDASSIDYIVKVAMCDGVGAEWTDEEKANSRARMGISEHITLTQSEYDALVEAGTVDENTYYYIKEE